MALSPIADDSEWPQEILETVVQEFLAVVDIVTPAAGTYSVDSNSITGATETPVITGRAARVQNVRLPLEIAGAYEWSGKSRYLFQIEVKTGDPLVEKGMVIRVRNGGNDKDLESWTFQVVGITSSSHAPLRNIDTYTEYGLAAA